MTDRVMLIFAEKTFPGGLVSARVAGTALIGYGAVVLITAHGLPGMTM